jgi:hypothetical protein
MNGFNPVDVLESVDLSLKDLFFVVNIFELSDDCQIHLVKNSFSSLVLNSVFSKSLKEVFDVFFNGLDVKVKIEFDWSELLLENLLNHSFLKLVDLFGRINMSELLEFILQPHRFSETSFDPSVLLKHVLFQFINLLKHLLVLFNNSLLILLLGFQCSSILNWAFTLRV